MDLVEKCHPIIKQYASEKIEKLHCGKTKNIDSLIEIHKLFILKESFDAEYAVMLSLLFCNEFLSIKKQVAANSINFEHLKSPDYWKSQITIRDAIFFSYTTMDNFFPQSKSVIENMLYFSEKHENFNYYTFLKNVKYK